MKKYILAIDQGTTSSRAILFDHDGTAVKIAQRPFKQYFTHPGWVEHDANEIWLSVLSCISEVLIESGISINDIAGIGITNQRETTVIWDSETSMPIAKAIVWQSRQSDEICNDLRSKAYQDLVHQTTGLLIDPYFSATKIRWLLDNVKGAKAKAKAGILRFGTIDTWLVWKLSNAKAHVTDVTNASRTMLFNIHTLEWDDALLKMLDIPKTLLPDVKSSSEIYAYSDPDILFNSHIPICGIAGDQQAALFAQGCFEPGSIKNTYGTGCFMLMNTGEQAIQSNHGLVTTIALGYKGKVTYALEGSIFVAGSAIQWLRDELHFLDKSSNSEAMATSLNNNEGVYLVPSFVGLGAPYWNEDARGMLIGLTRGTTPAHIVRAALESLAYQSKDVLDAMQNDSDIKINRLKVDGGASANNFLMQFQSDMLQIEVVRGDNNEATAFGAALLAGLAIGFWDKVEDVINTNNHTVIFKPQMDSLTAEQYYKKWQLAVDYVMHFYQTKH